MRPDNLRAPEKSSWHKANFCGKMLASSEGERQAVGLTCVTCTVIGDRARAHPRRPAYSWSFVRRSAVSTTATTHHPTPPTASTQREPSCPLHHLLQTSLSGFQQSRSADSLCLRAARHKHERAIPGLHAPSSLEQQPPLSHSQQYVDRSLSPPQPHVRS
jgi:hypothetical protein